MPPYKAKEFDPGRLIYGIDFYEPVAVDNGSGGQDVTYPAITLSTKAAQVKISEGNQLALEAGASVLNEDTYYVIRHRKNFYPQKDMLVKVRGKEYIIRAVIPINEPITHVKLLCIKRT